VHGRNILGAILGKVWLSLGLMQDILLIREIVLSTCLLDLFAEDSKFTPNEPDAAKENSSAIESNNDAVVQENPNDDTKNGAVAKKPNSKMTSPFCFMCNAVYSSLSCSNGTHSV